MCLAIPGKITEINGRKATVQYPTVTNYAFIDDVPVEVDDWVMVQMGVIIKKLSETEARQALQGWDNS